MFLPVDYLYSMLFLSFLFPLHHPRYNPIILLLHFIISAMTNEGNPFPIPRWTDEILEERYTVRVTAKALIAALNVMLLGQVHQGNRIIGVKASIDLACILHSF